MSRILTHGLTIFLASTILTNLCSASELDLLIADTASTVNPLDLVQLSTTPNSQPKLTVPKRSIPYPALIAVEPPPQNFSQLSPLQRPLYQLFGFETATPINQNELLIKFSANSFFNPKDNREFFENKSNRSNDGHINFTYGVAKNGQITVGLGGKDDTIFVNLIRPSSQLQILTNTIPVQAKWRFYNQNKLEAGIVIGAEIPTPDALSLYKPNREIRYRDSVSNTVSNIGFKFVNTPRTTINNFRAKDDAIYFSLAAPVSYQVDEKLRLHLNPQISILPSKIPVISTGGNINTLKNANIGFDGKELNYYGTIAGIGIGASYQISPNLQLAADFTPIIAGKNSADSGGDNSLFVAHPVWNVGMQYAPNSQTALSLFATNRFSPTPASPSNLLVQPGNDWSLGLNAAYAPDLTGRYIQNKRSTYPDTNSLLMQPSGFPSATLPASSIAYGFGVGTSVNPSIRFGLLDDVELALSRDSSNRKELSGTTDVTARLGLVPDQGQSGISGALGLGIIKVESSSDLAYSFYADSPISYRLPGGKVKFNATPKVLLPAQFQGLNNIFGVSVGASLQVGVNTEIMGQVTPILSGNNQLVANQALRVSGKTPVYSVGIRQLFPQGNSTYGVELFYGNGSGATGIESLMALPNRDKQVGVRFSILNGTPR